MRMREHATPSRGRGGRPGGGKGGWAEALGKVQYLRNMNIDDSQNTHHVYSLCTNESSNLLHMGSLAFSIKHIAAFCGPSLWRTLRIVGHWQKQNYFSLAHGKNRTALHWPMAFFMAIEAHQPGDPGVS